mmetsp:Transcript_1465/g.2501  ORF Transcript_1465/g.2501 Transcript_1465/m.2501 type:complete len:127 (+) Transcript_1465:1-381(+)
MTRDSANISEKKSRIDPPELRKPINYVLGDVGRPEDMADRTYANGIVAACCLRPGDHCFVRRHGGRFAFAKVLSCEYGPTSKSRMRLQVDAIGSTKSIPFNKFAKQVRPLHSMVDQGCARWKSSEL